MGPASIAIDDDRNMGGDEGGDMKGFRGSLSLVLTYVATLRLRATVAPPGRRYTPRQAALLFLRPPTTLTAEEQALAHMHQAAAELATTYQVAQDFAQLLRQRRSEALEPWLAAAQTVPGSEFRRFAAGTLGRARTHRGEN